MVGLYSHLFGWSNLGIRRMDLVLEVGSGGRPFARSDVLCDMYPADALERKEGTLQYPIVIDRPFICANAEQLPFKDNTFDFFLSAHTLEHVHYPEHFLREAMRVSQRGYIVTPSELCERILPRQTHLWLVSLDKNALILKQKRRVDESNVSGALHRAWETDRRFRRFFDRRPDLFEVRFLWSKPFTYTVTRQEEKPLWHTKATSTTAIQTTDSQGKQSTRMRAARTARSFLSQIIRRLHSRRFNLNAILCCPVCKNEMTADETQYTCKACDRIYPITSNQVPLLLADGAK